MSQYSKRMAQLSNRIFGEVVRTTDKKSMKVVRIFSGLPADKNPFIVNYYPKLREQAELIDGLTYHGLYRDDHAVFEDHMNTQREKKGRNLKYEYDKDRVQDSDQSGENLEGEQ